MTTPNTPLTDAEIDELLATFGEQATVYDKGGGSSDLMLHPLLRQAREANALRADLAKTVKETWELGTQTLELKADLAKTREALERAHACATIKPDGTCEGCFVSEALAQLNSGASQ